LRDRQAVMPRHARMNRRVLSGDADIAAAEQFIALNPVRCQPTALLWFANIAEGSLSEIHRLSLIRRSLPSPATTHLRML
jgi:hypothetical protein